MSSRRYFVDEINGTIVPKHQRRKVDDAYLEYVGNEVRWNTAELQRLFPDCDLFGEKPIAKEMRVTKRQVRNRLDLSGASAVGSAYHMRIKNIASDGSNPVYVFASCTNSVHAGNDFYQAAINSLKNTDGLRTVVATR